MRTDHDDHDPSDEFDYERANNTARDDYDADDRFHIVRLPESTLRLPSCTLSARAHPSKSAASRGCALRSLVGEVATHTRTALNG